MSKYCYDMKVARFDGKCIHHLLFRDLMNVQSREHIHLYQSALCLIGATGTGKTILAHTVSAHVCETRKKVSYFVTKALDSLGRQTLDGNMRLYSTLVMDDCEMRTLMDSKLTKAELLSLFHTQQGGSHRARYSPAIIPRGVVRVMTQNNRKVNGQFVSWFEDNEIPGGHALFESLSKGIDHGMSLMNQLGDVDQAIARRMLVCDIRESLITQEYWDALQEQELEDIAKLAADRAPDVPFDLTAPQRKLRAQANEVNVPDPFSPRLRPAAKGKAVARSSA
jgi:hypothetical protein